MADPFHIERMAETLAERSFPTVTVWNRLEGRPRATSFERSLRAEVRDPLWMLSRQWQVGEFRGDDAGSPFFARLALSTAHLDKYRARDEAAEPLTEDAPLEAAVERRPVPLVRSGREIALDLRLAMGRQWLKMTAGIGDYPQAFADRYPVELPDTPGAADADRFAHPEVLQAFAAAAGRRMDGGKLYTHLVEAPANRAYDGIDGVAAGDRSLLDDQAKRFVAWFERLLLQPGPAGGAWAPERLEYRFACSAPGGPEEQVLAAEEYAQGRLDWYAVDRDLDSRGLGDVAGVDADTLPEQVARTVIPAPVQFDGMPNTRWWAFEDGRTNFGAIDAATTDLAKLLFAEFALVYANDWMVIPCSVGAGTISSVRGLAVTNVFGERFWIDAAGSGSPEELRRWSMFTVSTRSEVGASADTGLVLLPTAPKVQQGDPHEEVVLVRDEMANMVWGVERVVPLASGQTRRGSEAADETRRYFERLSGEPAEPGPEPQADLRYRVATSVPENWIPFVPARVEGSNREIQLQRGAMPRVIEGRPGRPDRVEPRTSVLREGLDRAPREPYFVHEEEVPRAGARVALSFQRARGRDGRVLVWLGAETRVAQGEASSGLAFDQLVPVERRPEA